MKIVRLWLVNFRNYENAVIEFAGHNLLVGLNGAGKTNILEAIDILATSRSRIAKGLNKCIRRGQSGFALNGVFASPPAGELTIAFRQERGAARTIKINDEILARSSELIGRVNSVIFLPGDLELVQGPPAARRKYLDILISQTEREYYADLQNYTRALKQRNELFKNLRSPGLPDTARNRAVGVWDEQLAEYAGRLMLKRREYLDFFARETAGLYSALGFAGAVAVRYKTDVAPDKSQNLERLASSRAEDLRFGRTHWGAHADDFEFWLDDSKAAEFCSQGQRRLLAIAFKCAEAKIKTEKLNDPPVVLVDDVLLELDAERFNQVITAIAPQSQKIFTVTDTGRFAAGLLDKLKIIKITQGKIL
ncbi:MAG: DNA replication and repair protein RecF [Candidatus Margulisbacteria bacterium]|jgi:DNA replication and repair protein RecF|nr:DNA replication and repair protein RecF [Candidatus Margulisiibacteriota bacterium]